MATIRTLDEWMKRKHACRTARVVIQSLGPSLEMTAARLEDPDWRDLVLIGACGGKMLETSIAPHDPSMCRICSGITSAIVELARQRRIMFKAWATRALWPALRKPRSFPEIARELRRRGVR